jgi:hypothetical protein
VRAPEDWRSTFAADALALATGCDRRLEQRVDVTKTLLDRYHLETLLNEQVLAELIAAIHLEHQAAQVADPFLARPDERPALTAKRTWRRDSALGHRRRLGCGLGGCIRGPPAETVEQRWSCH